jgi:hypothetical protein
MEKAKAAVSDFMSKSGHHDTTVHEAVAPAVRHEVVKPHEHEEVQTAVDKEVHQDHYHRTIQPVQDREVLPEQHTARLGAVQHREFDHRDHDSTKRNLVEEQARFKDERKIDATTHSQSAAAAIGGEHVHHHIHETIQPVVQKETIQPNVIHTTVPIHEVHHNKATHHDTTALPAMTMSEFTNKGGSLQGREERYDAFEGVPKNIGAGTAGGFGAVREGHGHHDHHEVPGSARHGDFDNTARHGNDTKLERDSLSHGTHGKQHTDFKKDDVLHSDKDRLPDALTEDRSRADLHNTSTNSSQGKKPGLMDKLNPKVDADGDGKRGIMS